MTGHATSARQIGPVCHRHGPVRAVLAAGLLPVLLAAATAAGAADHFIVADDCHADYGELGNCTANEINIANASKAVTEAKFCIAGETVTIEQIDVTYGLNTGVRYDPLLWVGRTDNDPRGVAGTCFVSSVPPESGADYSIFRHLEGSEDPDLPPNDSCLDVSKPDPGDTVVNYATPFTVICTDSPDDEDNMADLQAVVTWLQNTNLVCGTDEGAGEDFAPGATSKCDWSLISLDIPVYPLGATLTLQKDVDNTGGGTAQDTDWTLAADGPVTVSGVEGEPEITAFKVPVGTYTLGESGGPAGYLAGNWSCTGGSLDGDQLTLAADDVAVCTITNTFITQSLSVTKNIVSDNGGGATLDDFDVEVDGVEVAWGSPGATGTGTELVTTDAGTYTLSESDLTGYAEGTWSCADQDLVTVPVTNGGAFGGSDVTVAAGQHVTCSITNDDIVPALTVIKHVINDDTGAAVAGDFTMMVTATNPSDDAFPGAEAPGTTITLDAGAYSVSETGPGGYVASYSAGCSGVLAVGETATCTVTNDDTDSPQLTVIVNVVTDNGGEAGPGEFTVEVTATNPSDDEFPGAASPGTTITLDPGDYDVGISGPSGYSPTLSAGCSGSLALGETASCTITMDDVAPELTVIKQVVNDDDGSAVAAVISPCWSRPPIRATTNSRARGRRAPPSRWTRAPTAWTRAAVRTATSNSWETAAPGCSSRGTRPSA